MRMAAVPRLPPRRTSTIELNIVKEMIQLILADLSTAFDPITSVNFAFDRLETNPRFATISRLSNAVIVAHLRVDMEDRGGKIDLMIPYATLEPVRELLLQMFMGERFGRDTIWENHLMSQLWETEVEVSALLSETTIKLGEMSAWEKGSFLPLDIPTHQKVTIVCGDVPLITGDMGRKDDHIVIRVDGKAEKNG